VALRSFREGDRVKVIILSIDRDKHKISLGLKPSYFAEEDFKVDDGNGADDQDDRFPAVKEDEDMAEDDVQDSSDDDDATGPIATNDGGHDDDSDESSMQVDDTPLSNFVTASRSNDARKGSTAAASVPVLKLQGGFQWSTVGVPHEDEVSESSSDDSDEDQIGKKKKRKRKAIEQDLTADMHTKTPESNADFERLLLGSPNSSFLWIQYMSFQLQLSEVEKAREIGKRALKTINFREEQEKLNVWIGLLNLENVYGTDETMEVAFKDAARHNDSKTIHLRLASIFDQTDKHEVGVSTSHVTVLLT
jgi:rRNA biogenesis protein RRP5